MSKIIEIKNISKSYSINRSTERYVSLRDVLTNIFRSPLHFLGHKVKEISGYAKHDIFWALKDVSVRINKGEIVGLIGPNGAGKSTLLKILNRITEPTSGEVIIHGKVSSLLEVGTGFHPELTGRENIFFSGAVLGMKRREIITKFDDIVRFAEVEQFLDTPVKRYSSGMHVRLAFSVAVHMEPDILLIDEVLAVGDASFQKKCLEKIHQVARRDERTILFVSHNLEAVRNLCGRSIYLERGVVKLVGPTDQVVAEYLNRQGAMDGRASFEFPTITGKPYQIKRVTVLNDNGLETSALQTGNPFTLRVDYVVNEDNSVFWLVAQCINEHGGLIFYSRDTDKNPDLMMRRNRGAYQATLTLPADANLSLNNGRYFLTVHIFQDQTIEARIPIQVKDERKKFPGHPGALLIGEPWKHERQS